MNAHHDQYQPQCWIDLCNKKHLSSRWFGGFYILKKKRRAGQTFSCDKRVASRPVWAWANLRNFGWESHTKRAPAMVIITIYNPHKWLKLNWAQLGVSKNTDTTKMDGFIKQKPIKMDDFGVPLFSETSNWFYVFFLTLLKWSYGARLIILSHSQGRFSNSAPTTPKRELL